MDVPLLRPDTIPVEAMVVTAVLPLLQVPPVVASLSIVVCPTQRLGLPVIGDMGLTVMVFVFKQPKPSEYVINVVPADTPVTVPVPLTEAMPPLPLVHAPPPVASLRVMVANIHTLEGPLMAAGVGLTVTILVAAQPPPSV